MDANPGAERPPATLPTSYSFGPPGWTVSSSGNASDSTVTSGSGATGSPKIRIRMLRCRDEAPRTLHSVLQPPPLSRARLLASVAWPVALSGVIAILVGTLGFNPTDEGLVLSYGYRILHGQIPHLDFISPRPIGSSLLHLIDFLMPGPLLLTSRVIALAEMTAIALLFGSLVFRSTPARWNMWQIALVVVALIVDLHTFPLMAWYTVDGALLTLGGLVLLRTEHAGCRRRWVGLLLCGAALTTKQSFFAAPVVGTLVASWPCLRFGMGKFARRFLVSALISALPMLLMVAVLAALGAGPAMKTQLLNPGSVNMAAVLGPSALWVVPVGCVISVAVLLARITRSESRTVVVGVRKLSPLLLIGASLVVLMGGDLSIDGDWGNRLLMVLLAYVAINLALTRRLDVDATLVVLLGWMVSLSWGYPVADLCGGGIVLTIAWRVWTLSRMEFRFDSRMNSVWVAAAAVISIAALTWGVSARQNEIYRDRSAHQLTAQLSSAAAGLAGLVSTPTTLRYLDDIETCVREHPARWVAVLPDNSALYMIMGWRNPFSIDWMLPSDYAGSEARLVRSARALDAKGNYLVLFQTFPAATLEAITPASYVAMTAQAAGDPIVALPYAPGVLQLIRDQLHGNVSGCATFIAVYAR
jgi:hypothetical protein